MRRWLMLGSRTTAFGVALAFSALVGSAGGAAAQERSPRCAASEYHQFDFWLGAWDVLNARGEADGTAEISLAPGGCGFIEQRHFASGELGVAFNLYDPVRGTWTQLWQAPGNVVRLEGRWAQNRLAMEGVIAAAQGGERPFRVVWTPQPDGSVQQDFFARDSAAAWRPLFSSTYRRRRA